MQNTAFCRVLSHSLGRCFRRVRLAPGVQPNYNQLKYTDMEKYNYMEAVTEDAQACDVTIRCYLLGAAISAALNEAEAAAEEAEG